jgi:LacI family transcriptional regulator
MTWIESGVLAGFLDVARGQSGWEVAVEAWNEIPRRGQRPDVVLVRGSRARRRGRIATVCIGRDANLPRVWVDDREVGRLAGRHLLAQGFRDLAYRGDPGYLVSRERRTGLAEVAAAAGAGFHDLPPGPSLAEAWSLAGERRDTRAALDRCPRPLGLLAFTAHVGRRILAAVDPGEVPNRLAVVAGDRDPLVAGACRPTLTGIDLGVRRMGTAAGELVAGLLAGRPAPAEPVLVPPVGVDDGGSAAGRAVADPVVMAALAAISAGAAQVPDMARAAAVSRRTLELRFAAALGEAPAAALRRHRLDRALERLRTDDAPIAAIAAACGWSSPARFSADIRAATGRTPQAWRLAARHG